MKTATAFSSHGYIDFNPETGEITDRQKTCDCKGIKDNCYFNSITRFDVEEYKAYHAVTQVPTDEQIDILDLGYWYKEGDATQYEKAAEDWRQLMIEYSLQELEFEGKKYTGRHIVIDLDGGDEPEEFLIGEQALLDAMNAPGGDEPNTEEGILLDENIFCYAPVELLRTLSDGALNKWVKENIL